MQLLSLGFSDLETIKSVLLTVENAGTDENVVTENVGPTDELSPDSSPTIDSA